MINLEQFSRDIVRPVLKHLGLYSLAAERLLIGTALTESGLSFLRQYPSGPALGVYQCESATYNDIMRNFLHYKPELLKKVEAFASIHPSGPEQLIGNMNYATAICRVHYYRQKAPLPREDDAMGMAQYHKIFYNSVKGKTVVEESIQNFRIAIARII